MNQNSLFPWIIPIEKENIISDYDSSGKTTSYKIKTYNNQNKIKKPELAAIPGEKALLKIYPDFLIIDGRPISAFQKFIMKLLAFPLYIASLPTMLIDLIIAILTFPIWLPIWVFRTFAYRKFLEWLKTRIERKPDSMFNRWLLYRAAPDIPAYLTRDNVVQVVKAKTGNIFTKKRSIIFVLDKPLEQKAGFLSFLPFMVSRRMYIVNIARFSNLDEIASSLESSLGMPLKTGKFERKLLGKKLVIK